MNLISLGLSGKPSQRRKTLLRCYSSPSDLSGQKSENKTSPNQNFAFNILLVQISSVC